jgi:hypothetical protein
MTGLSGTFGRNGQRWHAVGEAFRKVLLKKAAALDPVRASLNGKQAMLQPGEQTGRNLGIVLDRFQLCDPLFGPPPLVRMGNRSMRDARAIDSSDPLLRK